MLSVDTANLYAQEDLAIANMRLAITHSKLETHDLAVERIRSSLATFSRLIDRPTIPFDWLVRWAEAGKLAAKMEFNAGHIEEATQVVDRLETKLKELIEKEQSTEWAEEQLQSLDDLRNVLRPGV